MKYLVTTPEDDYILETDESLEFLARSIQKSELLFFKVRKVGSTKDCVISKEFIIAIESEN